METNVVTEAPYHAERKELYDKITTILSECGLPWYQARTVMMRLERDVQIAEGKKSTKEIVDMMRSASTGLW